MTFAVHYSIDPKRDPEGIFFARSMTQCGRRQHDNGYTLLASRDRKLVTCQRCKGKETTDDLLKDVRRTDDEKPAVSVAVQSAPRDFETGASE